jgi:hypothetical protein
VVLWEPRAHLGSVGFHGVDSRASRKRSRVGWAGPSALLAPGLLFIPALAKPLTYSRHVNLLARPGRTLRLDGTGGKLWRNSQADAGDEVPLHRPARFGVLDSFDGPACPRCRCSNNRRHGRSCARRLVSRLGFEQVGESVVVGLLEVVRVRDLDRFE